MGVIRVEHVKNYTVMSNTHLRDGRLSLRAKGLMSFMLSNSDTFEYSIGGLIVLCKEGRDAIGSALRELVECGYLVRTQTRDAGKFASNDYMLYEQPSSPLTEKPSTVKPQTGKPLTEKPSTVNPQQRNTNVRSNNINNPPSSPPEGDGAPDDNAECRMQNAELKAENGGATTSSASAEASLALSLTPEAAYPSLGKARRRRGTARKAPDWEPEMFARLWALYPRGEDKQAAMNEWDRLHADRELMNVMSAALKRQMASEEWRRGVGIPYLCRWLSKRRWEDDAGRDGGSRAPALQDGEEREEWT